MSDTTPDEIIYNALREATANDRVPVRAVDLTIAAQDALRAAGWSIVRADDHVNRKAVESIREAYVAAAAVPGNDYARWIVEDLNLILASK